jgi:hypothetical protein
MKLFRMGCMAALAALAPVPPASRAEPAPAPPPQGGFKLVLDYDGVLLIKVLDVRIVQQVEPAAFTADAQIRTSGVLALFKKVDLHAVSQGAVDGDALRPASFRHQNKDGHDNRQVQVRWEGGGEVTTNAAPYWPNMGEPVVTQAQKRAAADPLTQLMRLSLTASPDGPCHGPLRMFDGRELYDVTLTTPRPRPRTAVEARFNLANPLSCSLTLQEVAGFDPKPTGNKSQGLKMPVTLRIAQAGEDGPWIITGLTGSTPLGDARIELRSVQTQA